MTFGGASLAFASISPAAIPPLVAEERVVVTVRVLRDSGADGAAGSARLELPPLPERAAGSLRLADGAELGLEGSGTAGGEERPHVVTLEARLGAAGDGPPTVRRLELLDGTTGLVDVAGPGDRRLVLAVEAERVVRMVPAHAPATGLPVLLRVAVARVDGERVVPLESNRMSTFVGSGVEYAFRRGAGDDLESVTLRLTPERIVGDLVEVSAEISGTLPGPVEPLVLARRESLWSTRGSPSTLDVASGEPPSGYRFEIVPEF